MFSGRVCAPACVCACVCALICSVEAGAVAVVFNCTAENLFVFNYRLNIHYSTDKQTRKKKMFFEYAAVFFFVFILLYVLFEPMSYYTFFVVVVFQFAASSFRFSYTFCCCWCSIDDAVVSATLFSIYIHQIIVGIFGACCVGYNLVGTCKWAISVIGYLASTENCYSLRMHNRKCVRSQSNKHSVNAII